VIVTGLQLVRPGLEVEVAGEAAPEADDAGSGTISEPSAD